MNKMFRGKKRNTSCLIWIRHSISIIIFTVLLKLFSFVFIYFFFIILQQKPISFAAMKWKYLVTYLNLYSLYALFNVLKGNRWKATIHSFIQVGNFVALFSLSSNQVLAQWMNEMGNWWWLLNTCNKKQVKKKTICYCEI